MMPKMATSRLTGVSSTFTIALPPPMVRSCAESRPMLWRRNCANRAGGCCPWRGAAAVATPPIRAALTESAAPAFGPSFIASPFLGWVVNRRRRRSLPVRQPPQDDECDRDRNRKNDEEDRRLVRDRVTSLGDACPHVDAGRDEPEWHKDLGRGSEACGGRGAAPPAPDPHAHRAQHAAPGAAPARVARR